MLRMNLIARVSAVLTATAMLIGSAQAQTQEICFSDTVPSTPTNWMDDVTVSQFDPSLGTLQSIRFTLTTSITGSAAAENLGNDNANVLLEFSSVINLTRPDGSVIMTDNPLVSFNDGLAPFDGTIDFAPPSGITHANLVANDTEIFNAPPPLSDLILFTGTGTVSLPVEAIATSNATGPGNVVYQFTQQATATLEVCYIYTPNTPPFFTQPTCNSTLALTAGVPFSFQVCAEDSDPADIVTLTSGPLPPGAVMNPALPQDGNPVCSTFEWTPTQADIGAFTITFTAVDTHGRTATCQVNLVVAECFQLLGRGGSGSQIFLGNTLYNTHITYVRLYFAVTMDDYPSFPVPQLTTGQWNFSVQTVMHNADMFPTNPDQWSQRLQVTVLPGGVVLGQLHDTVNGINQSISIHTDPDGVQRMSFPFTINGM
jgi:hypothetical protein